MAATKIGIPVICGTCGRRKAPHGRSVPPESHYCQASYRSDPGYCPGYMGDPLLRLMRTSDMSVATMGRSQWRKWAANAQVVRRGDV